MNSSAERGDPPDQVRAARGSRNDPERREEWNARTRRNAHRFGVPEQVTNLNLQEDSVVMDRLAEMAVPTLVLAGALDREEYTVSGQYLERKMPNAHLVVIGANPYASNGSMCTAPDFPGRIERMRERGGRLVVVDPRRSRTAEEADLWLPIRPGTDALFLAAMVNTLAAEGLVAPGEHVSTWLSGLDEVVQGFLKFTRPEDLTLQPVRVATLFEEILPLVQPEAVSHGVKVDMHVSSELTVNGDAAMLRQALLNLAQNACQAMPQGGALTLRCGAASQHRVEIRVGDTGVGIAPEHLGKIFDLYFTTKERGTGIGLSMVYRIVQLHDGDIEVASTPGRGTTFRILLPRVTGRWLV